MDASASACMPAEQRDGQPVGARRRARADAERADRRAALADREDGESDGLGIDDERRAPRHEVRHHELVHQRSHRRAVRVDRLGVGEVDPVLDREDAQVAVRVVVAGHRLASGPQRGEQRGVERSLVGVHGVSLIGVERGDRPQRVGGPHSQG